MEKLVNNNTIVKNDIYNLFKDDVTCFLCKSIYIDPIMCMNCQSVYCRKCIDQWSKENKCCPKNCDNAQYKDCLGKKDILAKLNFKCEKCGNMIKYDEAKNHENSCTPGTPTPTGKSKMEKISSDAMNILINQGKEVTYITGK
jgi:hypothetical protein